MRDWLEKNTRGSLSAEGIFRVEGSASVPSSSTKRGHEDMHLPSIGIDRGIFIPTSPKKIDPLFIPELLECKDVNIFCDVMVKHLGDMMDFDIGTLKWRPLDLNNEEGSLEYPEEDLPEQLEFTKRTNLVIGKASIYPDEEMVSDDSPSFIDDYSGSFRAKSAFGDPIMINLRSAIFVPLRYQGELIGRLSLYSSSMKRSSDDLKDLLSPLWPTIGCALGRILEHHSMNIENDRTRDLLDSTDDILIIWRNRGDVWEVDCNRKAEELIDMREVSPDLMDGPFFVPRGKERERASIAWDSTYRSGESHQLDLELIDRSGEPRSFLCKFKPLINEGTVEGIRMTGVEMETLESGMRGLESANRTYRLLLSVLSHDLLNPLSAISGYNELQEYADEKKKMVYINKISSLTRRMSETISMVKTFSQLQEGKLSSDLESIDLSKMVSTCIEMLYPKTEDHNIIFESADTSFKIKGHGFLQQVILNLLDNSMKYCEKGAEIHIGLGSTVSGITLSVQDNGHGVPDRYKRSIFERFTRGERSTGIMGSGLGLAISKGIVDLHNGDIWVEDNPDGGSIFRVFLPWEP